MKSRNQLGLIVAAFVLVLGACSGCGDGSDTDTSIDTGEVSVDKAEVIEKVESELELDEIESTAVKEAMENQSEDLIAELEGASEAEMEEILAKKKKEIEEKEKEYEGSPIRENTLAALEASTERWVVSCEEGCACDSVQILIDAIMNGDQKTIDMCDKGGAMNDLLKRAQDAVDKCAP